MLAPDREASWFTWSSLALVPYTAVSRPTQPEVQAKIERRCPDPTL